MSAGAASLLDWARLSDAERNAIVDTALDAAIERGVAPGGARGRRYASDAIHSALDGASSEVDWHLRGRHPRPSAGRTASYLEAPANCPSDLREEWARPFPPAHLTCHQDSTLIDSMSGRLRYVRAWVQVRFRYAPRRFSAWVDYVSFRRMERRSAKWLGNGLALVPESRNIIVRYGSTTCYLHQLSPFHAIAAVMLWMRDERAADEVAILDHPDANSALVGTNGGSK